MMNAILIFVLWMSNSAALALAEPQASHNIDSSRRLGRRLFRNIQQRRQLQDSTSSCTFDKLINKTCPLWEFCSTFAPGGVEVHCGGSVDAAWYISMQGEETCYTDLQDETGYAPRSTTGITTTRYYCSKEQGFLNFTADALMYSDVTETITAPVTGILHEIYSISECTHDNEADYYSFGSTSSFCNDPCPSLVQVGGLDCPRECQECSNGRKVLNCADISPNLVEQCNDNDDATDNESSNTSNMYQEFLNYFQETNRPAVEEEEKETVDSVETTSSAAATNTASMAWMIMLTAFCVQLILNK